MNRRSFLRLVALGAAAVIAAPAFRRSTDVPVGIDAPLAAKAESLGIRTELGDSIIYPYQNRYPVSLDEIMKQLYDLKRSRELDRQPYVYFAKSA